MKTNTATCKKAALKGAACKTVLMVVFCTLSINLFGQKYSTFYHQRASLFDELPVCTKDIIFLGNSITNGGEWCELFDNKHVKNRGISGDITQGVIDRLDAVVKGRPAKIFLLIGINDLARDIPADTMVANIGTIISTIKSSSPRTRIYVQSILPVSERFGMFSGHTRHRRSIADINRKIEELTRNEGVTYIDLYTHFADPADGGMKSEYSNDGLHLLGKGYILWANIVAPYVKER
ncbi:MAG: sialate O-acetylesterase [Rikenellaceae bacterium]|nr:sialate O-acetylesterase [Rikenellaceae bacterium]MDE7356417.1 sialate O-acetylesterase [Rikenellaceae bacterium]